MKIIVTGASGWIGSFVARDLVRRGHDVHAIVRPSADIRRLGRLSNGIAYHFGAVDALPFKPDVLICLAWIARPSEYLVSPENDECLAMTKRLLAGYDGRVVVAGTCFEYDTALGRLSEDSPVKPLTPYSFAKNELRKFVETLPNAAYMRFFYQYGPREHPDRLVPKVIRRLMQGDPINLTHGEQLRDYLHVEDVASAVNTIALSKIQGVVNVGSGSAIKQKDLLGGIGKLMGKSELLRFGATPYYEGEPMKIEADNTKLLSLGWKSTRTIEEGLNDAVSWWTASDLIQPTAGVIISKTVKIGQSQGPHVGK